MQCNKCGGPINEGENKCKNCGNVVTYQKHGKNTVTKDFLITYLILVFIVLIFVMTIVLTSFYGISGSVWIWTVLFMIVIIIVRICLRKKVTGGKTKDVKYYSTIQSHFNDDEILRQKLEEKLAIMGFYITNEYPNNTYTAKVEDPLFDNVHDYISFTIKDGIIYLIAWCKQYNMEMAPHFGAFGIDHKKFFMRQINEIEKYFDF